MSTTGKFMLLKAEQLFDLAELVRQGRSNGKELADTLQTIANDLILKHVELDGADGVAVKQPRPSSYYEEC